MSNNILYTNFLRVAPTISYEGAVLANLFTQTFHWTRLAVFSTLDDVDMSDMLGEFLESAATNNITILLSGLYNSATTDYSNFINNALPLSPRIIVVLMKPAMAAPFLEQAYQLGLITEGVTIVGTTYTSDDTLFPAFTPNAPVQDILRGYIGLASNQ